jgi:hypothetical protein
MVKDKGYSWIHSQFFTHLYLDGQHVADFPGRLDRYGLMWACYDKAESLERANVRLGARYAPNALRLRDQYLNAAAALEY